MILKTFILIILYINIFGNNINQDTNITKNKNYLIKSTKYKISIKEKKYQEYKKQLEIENQKLEKDGFCSCNNN